MWFTYSISRPCYLHEVNRNLSVQHKHTTLSQGDEFFSDADNVLLRMTDDENTYERCLLRFFKVHGIICVYDPFIWSHNVLLHMWMLEFVRALLQGIVNIFLLLMDVIEERSAFMHIVKKSIGRWSRELRKIILLLQWNSKRKSLWEDSLLMWTLVRNLLIIIKL